MSSDLIIKHVIEYYHELKSQTQNNWIGFQLLFFAYVFFSQYTVRQGQRRLERLIPDQATLEASDFFVWVTEKDLRCYRVKEGDYDVPRVFPVELTRFVKTPTHEDLAHWVIEVDSEINAQKQNDIKRAITASAALHSWPIPKKLVLLDSGTKALWVRLGFDMELRSVTKEFVLSRVPVRGTLPDSNDGLALAEYQNEMIRVGGLLMQFIEQGDFPCFIAFLRILTGYGDLSKEQLLQPSTVQSIATAYAVKSGCMIPASYVHCNLLTLQLIGLDQADLAVQV